MNRWIRWVITGSLLGVFLVVILLASGFFTRDSSRAAPGVSPVVTIVYLPTVTATSFLPTATLAPTDTPTPVPPPEVQDGLQVGSLVEVTGTEGDGLRLREEPSLSAKIAFLGLENEVFEVREGPRQGDGYEWWYLSNPYNREKEGWAVSNYLRQADQQ
ncbi:MAG: SH3 domain-containing protein [Anaerolineales bacterium]|nr:SH3 domain-containing protein [Anaerolineales bacterium]